MLSDTMARAAKVTDSKYTISDIRGLHLEVLPTGRKFFRLRYTNSAGKRSWYTIGEFPGMSIDRAREETLRLQQRLKDGLPLADDTTKQATEPIVLFETVAREWADYNDTRHLSDHSKRRARSEMERYILPFLGGKGIAEVTPPDVLDVLQRIAADGRYRTFAFVRATISHIYQYAAIKGYAMFDPCAAVGSAIDVPASEHYATFVNTEDIRELLIRLNSYPRLTHRLATFFLIYSMTRPIEAVEVEWSEIDFSRAEWRVPAEKMKMRREHIVPLTDQLLEILDAMRPRTGGFRYVFPTKTFKDGSRPNLRTMFNKLLTKLGYTREQITAHGFRSMASTILNENGFHRDWIERQLAHIPKNKTRVAYCHTDFLKDRREMLAWYGRYLDEVRGKPINLRGEG